MIKDELARRCVEKMLSADTCSAWLGICLLEVGAGWAKTELTVTDNMVNGHLICHGGIVFTLADTTFACACNGYNRVTVAQGCNIEFLRPAMLGDVLTASGIEKKRGRNTGVYDIEVFDQQQRPIALFRGKSFSTEQEIL